MVATTIEALKAQVLEREEAERIEEEVQRALETKDLEAVSCFAVKLHLQKLRKYLL